MSGQQTKLQQLAAIARKGEQLAEEWVNGGDQRQIKDAAWALGQEVREINPERGDDDRELVIDGIKANKLLIEAIRTAAFSRSLFRTKAKSALLCCVELTRAACPIERAANDKS